MNILSILVSNLFLVLSKPKNTYKYFSFIRHAQHFSLDIFKPGKDSIFSFVKLYFSHDLILLPDIKIKELILCVYIVQ